MCCACGGGLFVVTPPLPPVPPSPPPQLPCREADNGMSDGWGLSCVDYHTFDSSWCGGGDTASFFANAMCCACGGGQLVVPSPPSPPLEPPAPPNPPSMPQIAFTFETMHPDWLTNPTDEMTGQPASAPPFGFHRLSGAAPSATTLITSGRKALDFYFYSEADNGREGDIYALAYHGAACSASGQVGHVTFWYLMYGGIAGGMGTLRIATSSSAQIWSVTGQSGGAQQWRRAHVAVNSPNFRFEAVRGST
eukprot:2262982-Prymnesium_polylepis.1